MKWIIAVIVCFAGLHTWLMVQHRKEDGASLPFEESRERGGHALLEAGWHPFPNALVLTGAESTGTLQFDPVEFQSLAFDHPSVRGWTRLLPNLSQGEEVRSIDAPAALSKNQPYTARVHWRQPEGFRPPQLLFFRRDNQFLIVPRAPLRGKAGSPDSTSFLLPPDHLRPGIHEILLVSGTQLNRWTFTVE